MEQFPAHIRKDGEEVIVQSVATHCRESAEYARQALQSVRLGETAYFDTLIHDGGKPKKRFANYLWRSASGEAVRRGSVNHTFAAVRFLLEEFHGETAQTYEDVVSELLAYAAGAHHGQFDCINERHKSGFLHRINDDTIDYEESKENYLIECASIDELRGLFDTSVAELTPVLEHIDEMSVREHNSELEFYLGLLARLLLSAVIEGDRRNTAEFCNGIRYPDYPTEGLWEQCLSSVEKELKTLSQDSEIQRARTIISEKCRQFAMRPSGIYRLNVPTGAGKTLSSLRYALAHAAHHKKDRIIFTSPLLSILEQNAAEIRRYVQRDDIILEHHSNVVREKATDGEMDPNELLTDNWNAKIIITTLVQLLNTLFSGKTSCIRRFHSLCNSVIVIDEVQTVPTNMLSLFHLAVNFLSEICGATVVLCSATQPCDKATEHPLLYAPPEIIPYDKRLWDVFRRTSLQVAQPCRLEEIPAFAKEVLSETKSLLIVCNMKKEAEYLFEQLKSDSISCFHLSASMCIAHRRVTVDRMKESLEHGKTLCVSTQVIEAGVDISFERVIRLSAGMDNIIQSAGRCNRNRESEIPSPVYLLTCMDENLGRLQEIQRAKDATQALLAEYKLHPEQFGNDLSSDDAIRCYYQMLYSRMPNGHCDFSLGKGRPTIYDLLSVNDAYSQDNEAGERFMLRQAFDTAGKAFQVFDDETQGVIVPYGEGSKIIEALFSPHAQWDIAFVKELLEKAKPYTVSLYDYQIKKLAASGALCSACNGSVFTLDSSAYDEELGVIVNENTFLEVNDL